MELLKATQTSNYWLFDDLIEGWNSLIWTERYSIAGEFELKTARIKETRALLPKRTLLGIRESNHVMIVESHSIEDGFLTVKGRTFETFLENRVIHAGGDLYSITMSPAMAIADIIYRSIVASASFTQEELPGFDVQSLDDTLPDETFQFKFEEMYAWILKTLQKNHLGLRTVKPTHHTSPMMLEVYNGLDKTDVVLSSSADHLKGEKYLFTDFGYKDTAYVRTATGVYAVRSPLWSPGVGPIPRPGTGGGFDWRVLPVDAMDLSGSGADVTQRGLTELAKFNQKNLFDAELTPFTPYKYGVDYGLGDYISVVADYGVSETMVVSEYIRIQDAEGEKSYPTLTLLDE